MTKIINLTQHSSSPSQQAVGVVDLTGDQLTELKALLTFTTAAELDAESGPRAAAIVELAKASGASVAMVGGQGCFMIELVLQLQLSGIKPVFAFTPRRVEVEQLQADGTIKKVVIFEHAGFNSPDWIIRLSQAGQGC